MAGPRSKRKRPEVAAAPAQRKARRDAPDGPEDPEVTTATTTAEPLGPLLEPQPQGDEGGESSIADVGAHPPLQEQINADGEAVSAESIGQSNLLELLSHRKLLLKRVRQGRDAAQKRLDLVREQAPSRKDEAVEQEIWRYKELARVATSLARKQQSQSDAAASEKRTSLSLRRGSGVGKRMNAALSTLSGSIGTTASLFPASDVTNQVQLSLQRAGQVDGAETAVDVASLVADSARCATFTTASASEAVTITPRSTATAGRPIKMDVSQRSMSTIQQQSTSVNKGIRLSGQKSSGQPTTAGVGANKANSISGPKGTGRQASISAQYSATGELAGNSYQMPQELLKRPSVYCPETDALRERKRVLEEKLFNVFRKRQESASLTSSSSPMSSGSSPLSPSSASVIASASGLPLGKASASCSRSPAAKDSPPTVLQAAIRGLKSPVCLQSGSSVPRRKTHWDYLLEEMRWLATDFVEERKWKACAARSLSRAVSLERNRITAPSVIPVSVVDTGSPDGVHRETAGDRRSESGESTAISASIGVIGESGNDLYTDPSSDDVAKAKVVSSILSSMIAELSVSSSTLIIDEAGANEELVKALERHGRTLDRLKGEEGPTLDNFRDKEVMNATEYKGDVSSEKNASSEYSDEERDVSMRDAEMQRISEFVDNVVSKVNLKERRDVLNWPSGNTSPIEFASDQRVAMTSIEDFWRRVSAGAILGGPIHSGKTLVACSLLWKFRLDGPQLVICSPLSMIRWMHELGRFDGLVRRPLSVDAGISSPRPHKKEKARYTACDVVLCEFAAFPTLSAEDVKPFLTIIVDGRYPNGFFGSRKLLYKESTSREDFQAIEPPDDLRSAGWWSHVSENLRDSPRRLLIESSTPSESVCLLQHLPDRQLLEVLALRLAFLFGARGLRMTGLSLAKSVLSWARRSVRKADQQGSKFGRVQALLVRLLDILYCQIGHSNLLNDAFGASTPKWDLRFCVMPAEQRDAYERVCRESRAALSAALDARQVARREGDRFKLVTQYLFRLRQICLHAEAHLLLADSRSYSAFHGPSQPDVQLALQVLEKSGKLQELMALLVYDCDLVIDGLEVLEPFLRKGNSASNSMVANKKADRSITRVAILASLPEAQLAVSLILNLLGVKHEALTATFSSDVANDASQAMRWARHQVSLSRFNDESFEQHVDRQKIMIVVSSIEVVAGDHCGLGVERADVVICLDEDWSGRNELQMKSLIARSVARLRSASCRFVKIVAADSCEQIFLSTTEVMNCQESKSTDNVCCQWPTSRFGALVAKLPRDESRLLREQCLRPGKNYFAFPASNISSLRGRDLATVLAVTEALPPLLSWHREMSFLPVGSDVLGSCQAQAELSASLISLESNRFPCLDSLRNVGRLDLDVLPSRLYLNELHRKLSSEHSQGCFIGDAESEMSGAAALHHVAIDLTGVLDFGESPAVAVNAGAALSSLLFYFHTSLSSSSRQRINAYSSSFSTSNLTAVSVDGNSGREALVYFPPLFPRLLDCFEAAQSDMASLQAQSQLDTIGKKRRAESVSSLPQQKRRRLDSDSFTDLLGLGQADVSMDFEVKKRNEKSPLESGLFTEDDTAQNDAASILRDLNDDFGVVGIGALATPQESAVAAGTTATLPFLGLSIDSWFGPDSDEADGILKAAMDAMILFVSRKRPRGHTGYPNQNVSPFQRPLPNSSAWGTNVNSISRSFTDSAPLANINGAQKKLKKKLTSQAPGLSAFNRLPSLEAANPLRPPGQAITPSPKSRDIYRSRLLMTLRQTSSSRTLFGAPSFRSASSRVRQRIAGRVGHLAWTSSSSFDSGSGLPLLPQKHHLPVQSFAGSFRGNPIFWTSVAKRLRNRAAATGDEVVELADSQALAFHQSYVSPCRVDFGPFQSGFQASVSGMTSALPIRPRLGVSLPMGVKLPSHRDPLRTWSKESQDGLRVAVEQFGTNWILVSRFICGYRDIGSFLSRSRTPRSPRSCRDQWQTLPLAQREVSTKHKQLQDANAGIRQDVSQSEVLTAITGIHGNGMALTFLLPSGLDKLEDSVPGAEMHSSAGLETEEPKGRRFDRIMAAKAKSESVSMQIPGLSSDGSPPPIVSSHPSHMQAVQTSAASSWSNGRTEMWPLQLLDAADRYKSSLALSVGASAASMPAPHHASSRSSSASNPNPRPNGGSRAAVSGSGSLAAGSSAPYVRGQQHPRLAAPSGGPIAPHPPAPQLRPQSFAIPPPKQLVPLPPHPPSALAVPLPHPPADGGTHPSAPPSRDPAVAAAASTTTTNSAPYKTAAPGGYPPSQPSAQNQLPPNNSSGKPPSS